MDISEVIKTITLYDATGKQFTLSLVSLQVLST